MKQFQAIVLQTIRSAIRSKVFHVLFVLILLSVFSLPLTTSGDGTAVSLVQITITFSLGIVVALISTTALWLSCSQLSIEIEKYHIHTVVVKPCPKWIIWIGKWFGIFIMHAIILVISAIIVFILIQVRVALGDFSEKEIQRLDAEVRVGRIGFRPQYDDNKKEIDAQLKKMMEETPNLNPDAVRAELLQKHIARDGEILAGKYKEWTFPNIRTDKKTFFLRFRLYSGSATNVDQQVMYFTWKIKDPASAAADPFVELDADGKNGQAYHSSKGGAFQEWEIDVKYIDPVTHSVTLQFYNMNHKIDGFGKTIVSEVPETETADEKAKRLEEESKKREQAKVAVLQRADGPVLLIPEISFGWNFVKAILQAMMQIAFLTALGCAVSAAFSTPVAAFVAISYLLIGITVKAAVDAPLQNPDGSYIYNNVAERGAHILANCVDAVVVSVDDFDATSSLAHGALVTNPRFTKAVLSLKTIVDSPFVVYPLALIIMLLRWVFIFGIGIWIFQKRELGAVIRK